MSTDGPANKPASSPHVHGAHCSHCGTALMSVQEYTLDDRFAQVLFGAVCQQMGLTITKSKRRATFSVRAEPETLDRLAARVQELLPQLDDRLMTVAQDFLREHTGQEIGRRAR